MRILKAGLIYFLQVFSVGFLLGLIRIPLLVPALGVRAAELLEMPVMIAVIVWASRRLARRHGDFSRGTRLAAGVLAFALLAAAELTLAWFLQGQSPLQYVAARDPVSGSAYFFSLLVFAVAPALWNTRAAAGAASGAST